ncbi:MAG: hypothetical protein HY823_14520 [Acidobacteria bacterium]|nr:hypothetical protein [Acidobacteriota bacterium]
MPEPLRLPPSTQDLLEEIQMGFHLASLPGPAGGLAYLKDRAAQRPPLPAAVLKVVYTLMADAQAALEDWEGCADSVARATALEEAAQAEFTAGDLALEWDLDAGAPPPPGGVPPAAGPAIPLAPPKICRRCGKDVSHKVRRKNPATGAYLCYTCYHARREKRRKDAELRRWILRAVILLAVAVAGAAMVLANLGD